MSKSDDDDSYVVKPRGTVSNQAYRLGPSGSVIIQARSSSPDDDERRQASGVLVLTDGTRVRCEQSGPTVWGTDFGPLDLVCETEVDLEKVEELVLDGGSMPEDDGASAAPARRPSSTGVAF